MRLLGARNGAILAAQIIVFLIGAVSMLQQGINTLLFVWAVIGLGALGGYVYPRTIDWAWEQIIKLSRMPQP